MDKVSSVNNLYWLFFFPGVERLDRKQSTSKSVVDIIPAGLEQVSRIMDARAGIVIYKDEREQYLKLEAGALAFRYAKIACVILLCLTAALNYFTPSLLFIGIVLGLTIFLIVMYGMELIVYFYYEKIK